MSEEALLVKGVFDGVEVDWPGLLAVMVRRVGAFDGAGAGVRAVSGVGGAVKAGL